jgi:hypothetical protein
MRAKTSPRPADEQSIDRSFSTLQRLLDISQAFLREGRDALAAASAEIAALYASYNHPGEFTSPRLETILRAIGHRAIDPAPASSVRRPDGERPMRVLQVMTAAKDVGGDTRFVWRWMQRDTERCHSVALTWQSYFDVPAPLSQAVAERHGQVHVLDAGGRNAIERARALRELAQTFDVVFLHLYVEDVVPVIAFADRRGLPPIIFVVQADHQFWTGASVCDGFVHLRESGRLLSAQRRGIEPARMAELPIPLEPNTRVASRAAAKKALDLPEDAVVLLSIARAIKYQPIGSQPSFLDVMIPIIREQRNAVLLAVGPADTGEWATASEMTGGRIRAMGQRSDTQLFYEAADIYLDSFPFTSNTSLLEAGSFGLPLVSYFPYSAESEVLGPGAPGLDRSLVLSRTLEDYNAGLTSLIDRADVRRRTGECTRNDIDRLHIRDGWNEALEAMYRTTLAMAPRATLTHRDDSSQGGELDVLLNQYYSRHFRLGWVIGWYARQLPYWSRLMLLARMMSVDRSFNFSMLLPDRLQRAIGGRLRGWRELPVIARWLVATGSEGHG